MAKELPYYKHEPSEWLEGEIQICSDEAIVCFINLCSGYWLKLGCMSYAFALQKYCRRNGNILQELVDAGMVDLNNENISIKFLDKQLSEFNNVSEKRSKAAQKRWSDANALQVQSKSNAIREDKIREKNNIPSVEEFVSFGVSLIEDVSVEALKLKHQSWLVNDWCKEKSGKLIKIVNWKSTLSNTISYLPKQPKQLAKSEDQIRYEHVMKQMELNK
jgi:hypothetical protein